MKWTTAQAIHYDVVAEYEGNVALFATQGAPVSYHAPVKDRFEIGFDWSPGTMALVGKPVFKNFPSTLPAGTPGGTIMGKQCPPPKVNGDYDHAEVVGAKDGPPASNSLVLTMNRRFPAGEITYAAEGPCNIVIKAAAKTETVTDGMLVPMAMWFAMPQAAGENVTIDKQKQTIVFARNAQGWTYTYSVRIVK